MSEYHKNPSSSHPVDYKLLYEQCKLNIKKFMLMVEREFIELVDKHEKQKKYLQEQNNRMRRELSYYNNNKQLKYQINNKQEGEQSSENVSNFTIKSRRYSEEKNRSQGDNKDKCVNNNNNFSFRFDEIDEIQMRGKQNIRRRDKRNSSFCVLSQIQHQQVKEKQEKISKISKISDPNNTLREFANILTNHKEKDDNIISFKNLNQFITKQQLHDNHDDDQTKQSTKGENIVVQKLQRSFKALKEINGMTMNQMFMKKTLKDAKKEEIEKVNKENQLSQQSKQSQGKHRTENKQKISSERSPVHNVLRNLRNTINQNIQKQANLSATKIVRL